MTTTPTQTTGGSRPGAGRRLNDLLVAPGANRAELWTTYAAAVFGAALALAVALRAGMPPLAVVLLTVLGFDIVGGAVATSTAAAKRRFHGSAGTRGRQLAFVAGHVHVLILALVVPGLGWLAAVVIYAVCTMGAAVVLVAPRDVRRPVAFAVAGLGSVVTLTSLSVPTTLDWVAPLMLVKLLLGYLLPEGDGR